MTSTQHSDIGSMFFEARTRAEREWSNQQQRAIRLVAGQAHDRTDYADLLLMLDLDAPALHPTKLSRRLAIYLRQVAVAIGVPVEATGYEVADTATAYLVLDQQFTMRPGHELVLAWDERLGWYVTVAPSPSTEAPSVIAYLNGDIAPSPAAVARFVADVIAGRSGSRIRPVQAPTERTVLAAKLAAACPNPPADQARDGSG
jgi:hypothetical protein